MGLEHIFPSNLINSARIVSKDSKIYEAFKPYLLGIFGISLEDYMKNKEIRRTYRQKYATIKANFQEQAHSRIPLKDEECLTKITAYGKEWQEFISTARENTLDEGRSFIRSTPLDSYILMAPSQKADLERQLVSAAIARVRTYTTNNVVTNNKPELKAMLEESNNALTEPRRVK